jgi:hypothetical protein
MAECDGFCDGCIPDDQDVPTRRPSGLGWPVAKSGDCDSNEYRRRARTSIQGSFSFFPGASSASLLEVEALLLIAQTQGYFTPELGNQLLNNAADLRTELDGLFGAIAPAA